MTFDLTPSWSCIVFHGKYFWFVFIFRRNAVDLKDNMESSSVLKYTLPCWSIPPLSCIQLPPLLPLFVSPRVGYEVDSSFLLYLGSTDWVPHHNASALPSSIITDEKGGRLQYSVPPGPPPLSLSGFRGTYTVLQRNITLAEKEGRQPRYSCPQTQLMYCMPLQSGTANRSQIKLLWSCWKNRIKSAL